MESLCLCPSTMGAKTRLLTTPEDYVWMRFWFSIVATRWLPTFKETWFPKRLKETHGYGVLIKPDTMRA